MAIRIRPPANRPRRGLSNSQTRGRSSQENFCFAGDFPDNSGAAALFSDLMDFVNLRASSLDVRADTETLNIFTHNQSSATSSNYKLRGLPGGQAWTRAIVHEPQLSPVALCAAANYNLHQER